MQAPSVFRIPLTRYLTLCGLAALPLRARAEVREPEIQASPSVTTEGLVLTPGTHKPLPPAELAAFAAGCFWGVEDAFRHQPGVLATAVGFEGGHTDHPSYEQVCTENTGHAETVLLAFDPTVVSYETLLDLFFRLHDPTTLNRQGPDFGDQYRSAIFTYSDAQRTAALAAKARLQAGGELHAPIVTEITKASPFFKAEEYHQQYVEKGGIAFCHVRRKHPAEPAP